MKNLIFLALLLVSVPTVLASVQTPKSNWAKFGDNKIHYYDIGSSKQKSALVFVHCWTCNNDFWRESMTAFPEMRVIAVDLIGHGKSDKPKTDYTMEYFAKSIEAVLKNAKVEKAVLVGHSMGTPVVRQFYRLYPEKTAGLVVVDGALRPFAPRAEIEKFFAPMRANYKQVAQGFIDGMLQPIKEDKLKTEIRTAMLATPDYVALSAMDGMYDEKIYTPDKINVPVLAILAKSPFWAADTEQFLRGLAPNLEFQMWDGVSHFLMMEKPAEFNQSVKAFLVKNKLAKK
ncbi:MAG TPA: alpha/beta hydrolase [Pyrinomonadaceae bacterium]|jgi:pimeloyl-ACP methyl ester carboxylesterase